MTEQTLKIQRLKELQEAKKAAQAPQSAVIATFKAEPSAMSEPKETPTAEPPHGNSSDPMPKSLLGMTTSNIELASLDGRLSKEEEGWLRRRKGRPIDFSSYGERGWMAM